MNALQPGTTVLASDGSALLVDDALAKAFRAGDRVVADASGGLLHIPACEIEAARAAVDAAASAFAAMNGIADAAIVDFYGCAATALADDVVWSRIAEANAVDVEAARRRGRSTTRLAVSDAMRANMIAGLRGWAEAPSRRGAVLETVEHDGFRIEMVGAALGVWRSSSRAAQTSWRTPAGSCAAVIRWYSASAAMRWARRSRSCACA